MAKGPMALWLLDGGAQLLDVPHYIGPWFCESFPAKPFGGQWWILFGEVHFDGSRSDGFVGIVQRSGTGWQCDKCLELLGKSGRINLPFRLFVLRLAAKLSVCPRLLPQAHLAKKNEKRKPKIQSGQKTRSGVRDINSIRAAMIRGNEMAIEVAD